MTHATLHIQCRDNSGRVGDFIRGDDGKDLSPTFPDLGDLFIWLRGNGWRQLPHDSQYPTGRYEHADTMAKV